MLFGIVARLFYKDSKQHHLPHIHAEYKVPWPYWPIEDGRLLEGSLPQGKMKLVAAWIEIHRDTVSLLVQHHAFAWYTTTLIITSAPTQRSSPPHIPAGSATGI
jgi:hypothetical protein